MSAIKKIEHNVMSAIKKTQYGGDVVMFLLNKIIKIVGLAHGFKTINHVHGLHMVLKPCTYVINVGQEKT